MKLPTILRFYSAGLSLLFVGTSARAEQSLGVGPSSSAASTTTAVGSLDLAPEARPEPSSAAPARREAPSSALPKETTVLHLGDSFAGALGQPLHVALQDAGLHSVLKFKSASYIPEWASPRMGVASLVNEKKPDLVLITLGGNELEMLDPAVRAEPIRRLIAQLGGRPCVWIAPSIEPKNKLMDVVRANLGPCRFFDTRALVPELPRLPDRIHPTIPARKQWATLVLGWLAQERSPAEGHPWQLRPDPTH